MGKLAARKNRVKQMVSLGAVNPAAEELLADLDARVEAIQLLIPLGLQAVAEELDRAVVELAGARYQRKDSEQPHRRWGSQPGSVYLGDQKPAGDRATSAQRGKPQGSLLGCLPGSAGASENGRRSVVANAERHRHAQLLCVCRDCPPKPLACHGRRSPAATSRGQLGSWPNSRNAL